LRGSPESAPPGEHLLLLQSEPSPPGTAPAPTQSEHIQLALHCRTLCKDCLLISLLCQ
jgi:hypothetical protein